MIRFEHVSKKFGNNIVLNDISFQVSAGQITFVIGVSGTGKSVMLKSIVGLLQPEAGKIWIENEEVSGFSEQEFLHIRKKCGMVFQNPALFDSLNIYENIAFGLRRHYRGMKEVDIRTRVQKSLRLVHLKGIESQKPAQISFGMQKRVSIARTIALEPKILLFDEPTTGLDPITTNAVTQLIHELSRELNTTSVVVSHDMYSALAIADNIIMLDSGKIIAQGSPQQLRTSKHPLVMDFFAEVTSQ